MMGAQALWRMVSISSMNEGRNGENEDVRETYNMMAIVNTAVLVHLKDSKKSHHKERKV